MVRYLVTRNKSSEYVEEERARGSMGGTQGGTGLISHGANYFPMCHVARSPFALTKRWKERGQLRERERRDTEGVPGTGNGQKEK